MIWLSMQKEGGLKNRPWIYTCRSRYRRVEPVGSMQHAAQGAATELQKQRRQHTTIPLRLLYGNIQAGWPLSLFFSPLTLLRRLALRSPSRSVRARFASALLPRFFARRRVWRRRGSAQARREKRRPIAVLTSLQGLYRKTKLLTLGGVWINCGESRALAAAL